MSKSLIQICHADATIIRHEISNNQKPKTPEISLFIDTRKQTNIRQTKHEMNPLDLDFM